MTEKKKKRIRRKVITAIMLAIMLAAGLVNHLFFHYNANAGHVPAMHAEHTVSVEIVCYFSDSMLRMQPPEALQSGERVRDVV